VGEFDDILPESRLIESVDLEAEEGHDLLKMLVVPRPVAWVTTLRPNGVVNLAPFATYTMLGFGPMLVGLAIARVKGTGYKKDTLKNIEHGREFVIHTVTEDMLDKVVSTARMAPAEESKSAERRSDAGGFAHDRGSEDCRVRGGDGVPLPGHTAKSAAAMSSW
jgi:flavin reductase (DIM6/NTAB) family NADH-FMN oxidoreductase RutF